MILFSKADVFVVIFGFVIWGIAVKERLRPVILLDEFFEVFVLFKKGQRNRLKYA